MQWFQSAAGRVTGCYISSLVDAAAGRCCCETSETLMLVYLGIGESPLVFFEMAVYDGKPYHCRARYGYKSGAGISCFNVLQCSLGTLRCLQNAVKHRLFARAITSPPGHS